MLLPCSLLFFISFSNLLFLHALIQPSAVVPLSSIAHPQPLVPQTWTSWGWVPSGVPTPNVGPPVPPQLMQYGLPAPVQHCLPMSTQYGLPAPMPALYGLQTQYGLSMPMQYGLPMQMQYGLLMPMQYGLLMPMQYGLPMPMQIWTANAVWTASTNANAAWIFSVNANTAWVASANANAVATSCRPCQCLVGQSVLQGHCP